MYGVGTVMNYGVTYANGEDASFDDYKTGMYIGLFGGFMVAASAPGADSDRPSVKAGLSAAAVEAPRNWRRSILVDRVMVISRSKTGHSLLDTLVGAADADVLDLAGDLAAMVAGLERGSGGHQHAGLAVASLRYLVGDPGLLRRVTAVGRETLDRGDGLAHRR